MPIYKVDLISNGNSFTLASSTNYQNAEWMYNSLKVLKQANLLKVDKIQLKEIDLDKIIQSYV